MAAARITKEDCDGLRALLDSIGPDPAADDLVANDLEFHRRIVACSGNSVLASLLESMSGPPPAPGSGAASPRSARGPGRWPSTAPSWTRSPPTTRRWPGWATVDIAGVKHWLASVP